MTTTSTRGFRKIFKSTVTGVVLVTFFVVGVILAIFLIEQQSLQRTINQRDGQIHNLSDQLNRLEIAYSRLRDQDFSLNIAPAAPSLGSVINPGSEQAGLPVPRSFTAAFPTGRFTCVDKTGEGNYFCSVTVNKVPVTTTTKPSTTPAS